MGNKIIGGFKMKVQVLLDENSRIICYAFVGGFVNGIEIEVNESIDDLAKYKYINGELIKISEDETKN